MSEFDDDPKLKLRQGIEALRAATAVARERVVTLLMRRNSLETEVKQAEERIRMLTEKLRTAEGMHSDSVVSELRQELDRLQSELDGLKSAFAEATAQAEAAKLELPEQEHRFSQLATQLGAQFADNVAATVEAGDAPDSSWSRATAKIEMLRSQAGAIQEQAAPEHRAVTPERVEEMLQELESRLTPTPANANAQETPQESAAAASEPPVVETGSPQQGAVVETGSPQQNSVTDAGSLQQAETPGTANPTAAAPGRIDDNAQNPAPGKSWSVPNKGDLQRMEPTQRVRVAGVGTGNIFRGAHLSAYPALSQVQLVALCDPDKEAQKLAFKRYQSLVEERIKAASEKGDTETVERLTSDLETVQICDDISEVIETVKPDVVDICTQPFLHAPLSIQAMEAGIHVMCEKPMARTWLETQEVIEVSRRTGKTYQHNENWLFDADYYTAKKLVDAGVIGEPILMFLATAHGGPEGAPKFWDPTYGGGGALLDNGIHAIGASWFISGLDKRPTLVKAAEPFGMSTRMKKRIIDGRYQDVRVDDDAHILIRFEHPETGAWSTAHVEGSWSHRDSPDTVIIGTTGRIEFKDRNAVVIDAYGNESRRIETSGPTWQPWPSSFFGEIQNMAECVRNGVQSLSGPEFGADCSAIVGASYLSELNGRKASSVEEFKTFARGIAAKYAGNAKAANDALVDALLAAVRK
jgi:predicted dehydrogenase